MDGTMREIIAAAIANFEIRLPGAGGLKGSLQIAPAASRDIADAVLEVMGEPTGLRTGPNEECEGMMAAGLEALFLYDREDDPVAIVNTIYTAMIDAARTPAKES